jgi:hypothetical protein
VVASIGHRRDLFSALAFFPTSKALYFGQISPIFLWVWSFVSAERTSSAARGLALSLGVLKPNLFIPIALFLTLIDREPRTLLITFICGVILQVALCWLVFPGIFDAFVAPEAPWLRSEFLGQPTVNRFLFPFLGFDVRWAWFMMVSGSVALWAVIRRRRGQHDIPQVLAPIACLGAPYLWAHDLLICLPLWLAVVRGHPSSILRVVSDLGMISATVVFLYGGFFVEASAIVIPVLLAYYALAVVPKGRAR